MKPEADPDAEPVSSPRPPLPDASAPPLGATLSGGTRPPRSRPGVSAFAKTLQGKRDPSHSSKIATEGGTARATWPLWPQLTNGPNGPQRGPRSCHKRWHPRGIWWWPRVPRISICLSLMAGEGAAGTEAGGRCPHDARSLGLGLLSLPRPQITQRLGCVLLTLLTREHTQTRAHLVADTHTHVRAHTGHLDHRLPRGYKTGH